MVMTKQPEGIRRAKRATGESSTKEYDIWAKAPAVTSDTEVNLGYTQSQPDKTWKAFAAGAAAWPTPHKNHTEAVLALIEAYGTGSKDSGTATDAGEAISLPPADGQEHTHPGYGEPVHGVEAPADGSEVTIGNEPAVVDVDPTPGGGPSPDDPNPQARAAHAPAEDQDMPDEPDVHEPNPPAHPFSPEPENPGFGEEHDAQHPGGSEIQPNPAESEQLPDGRTAHKAAPVELPETGTPGDRREAEEDAERQRAAEQEERASVPVPAFSNAAPPEADPLFPRATAPFPEDPFADPFAV